MLRSEAGGGSEGEGAEGGVSRSEAAEGGDAPRRLGRLGTQFTTQFTGEKVLYW
jgi:hypothetical protein